MKGFICMDCGRTVYRLPSGGQSGHAPDCHYVRANARNIQRKAEREMAKAVRDG